MGWTFGNSSVHSSPVTAGRGKLHRWVSSKSYPIFTSHFHIRTWHKILKEWATTNRINNGIMQDPAKMKVLILFGCSNMYCGKLWNIKHLSKHLVAAFNMFVSNYAEHLLFMILWEDLHCSWPSYKLYFCKQSAPHQRHTAGYCPSPRHFLSWFLWHIWGRKTSCSQLQGSVSWG